MKKLTFILALLLTSIYYYSPGQTTLPYFNNFKDPIDTTGWFYYSLSGTNDLGLEFPNSSNIHGGIAKNSEWVTNLTGNASRSTYRYLATPTFNLSDTSIDYVLSFTQKLHSVNARSVMQYSTDNGVTWNHLNHDKAKKKNWMGNNGWMGNTVSCQHSKIGLSFLHGNTNLIFRYLSISKDTNHVEWPIDDFCIKEEYNNIFAISGDSIFVTQNNLTYTSKTEMGFNNEYGDVSLLTTNYFFSTDTILDANDNQVSTYSAEYFENSKIERTIALDNDLSPGNYYIFHQYDALNVVQENDETDNIQYSVIHVDTVYNLPYINSFENNTYLPLEAYLSSNGDILLWEMGRGYSHHLEDTHSGENAWHTSKSVEYKDNTCTTICNVQYVEFPNIDLTSISEEIVFNFWFKDNMDANGYRLQYNANNGDDWYDIIYIPPCRNDEWDYINVPLHNIASNNSVKFRIEFESNYLQPEGIIFDDVYIGSIKPDLSIEGDKKNLFTANTSSFGNLKYHLCNSGLTNAPPSRTTFYWSNDSILDVSDILLGTKEEQVLADSSSLWTNFSYAIPPNSPEKFFLFYELDTDNSIDEMREYNNGGYFTIFYQTPATTPYFNDFESQIDGWRHNASLGFDDWQWTTPNGIVLNSAFSGMKAWITSDTGSVHEMSRMHLYTPVFDLTTSINPVIEFDMQLEAFKIMMDNEAMTNLSYSKDGGCTWIVLDTTNQSYNRWYYQIEYNSWNGLDMEAQFPNQTKLLFDLFENAFVTYDQYNGRGAERNTRYIIDIKSLAGEPQIQFRYNLASGHKSDSTLKSPEGALIDNFSIREAFIDLNVTHKKALMISSLSSEIKFFMNIKNQGNYISSPGIAKYYLSNNINLDNDDINIGQENIPAIRPDMSFYVNAIFDAPTNLSEFKYLIYELDAGNTSMESNESNNIGYWELALDSINEYPYNMDFNDSIIDGWHEYGTYYEGTHRKEGFRFRNMTAPGEHLYSTNIISGIMFTDRINNVMSTSQVPIWHLETPAFNFKKLNKVLLSFDLLCVGDAGSLWLDEGGNLDFSTDGGNSWQVLTAEYGQAFNWYNNNQIGNLNGEPGWTMYSSGWGIPTLDSVFFDLSFLRGEEHVVFRFKYRSNTAPYGNGTVQGMRIDNFEIAGQTIDYITNNDMVSVTTSLDQPDINLNYSITNLGPSDGQMTITRFYWSNDSIFDPVDPEVFSNTQNPITAGNTLNLSATFDYPIPLRQSTYYVFYLIDADSTLVEINELNNVGSFKIIFPPFWNYMAHNNMDTIITSKTNPTFNVDYSIINNGSLNGTYSKTGFYWSEDSILDAFDQNIITLDEIGINSGDTLRSYTTITYPTSNEESRYYLFYKTDDNSDIDELYELDNTGSFLILFEINSIDENNKNGIKMYLYKKTIFIEMTQPTQKNTHSLTIKNLNGKLIYKSVVQLQKGLNRFDIPNDIAKGMYFISLSDNHLNHTAKVVLSN